MHSTMFKATVYEIFRLTGPTLQDAGSVAPDNCSGSGRTGHDNPQLAPVSGTQAISVYRVLILGDGEAHVTQ